MNTRQHVVKQSLHYYLQILFWIPVIFFSVLLVWNTLPYFNFKQDFSFIQERELLFKLPFYRFCFYTHIAAGAFCILSALFQFSTSIIKKRTAIHVWSGRIYVLVVLLIGAPTGMFMSFFAKGSIWEQILFMFMAITWFYATAKGLQTILQKNVLAHKHWMMRSYAMAMTAVTFRVYHLFFYYMGWSHLENYEISLWISVIGNILFAEFFIYIKNKKYIQTFIS